jgi:hypothetical protein
MILKANLLVLIIAASLFAGKIDRVELERPRSLKALRVQTDEIRIDGVIDDAAWESANFLSNFVQRDPIQGDSPTETTEFAILYDNEYLYVAIRALDSEREGIRSILSRRDEETPSDWVNVSLDSYGDNRTAFEFWLNPQGVKRDIRRYDDSEEDLNWDAIWDGKATVQATGWSAEYRIPFQELRFSGQQDQSWGLQVYRHISRKNEDIYWTYWDKEQDGHVRHYGELAALYDIPQQRRLYVAPYTTGQYAVSDSYINEMESKNYRVKPNVGADIKFGVTNNLTLDVTLNPDFGQVEADPGELNLTDFESFYEEKRPFFIEGSNIYQFPMAFGGSNNLFYPRRIGRKPQLRVANPDGTRFIDAPTATTILGAGKLSGKNSSGTSIGILNAVASEEVASIKYLDQATEKSTVEPLTNYFVSRIQQDLNKGNTTLGGIFTAVNRDLDSPELQALRRDAYTAGVDFSHRFADATYLVEGMLAGSHVAGSPEALVRTQMSSTHYFQRPDNGNGLSVDEDATDLTGYAYKLRLSKIRGEHIRGNVRIEASSPQFEANDAGYHGFVGQRAYRSYLQYREDEPGKLLRTWNISTNGNYSHVYGAANELMGWGGNMSANLTFLNYWYLSVGTFYNGEANHLFALWGGPALVMDPTIGVFWTIRSDDRKALYAEFQGNRNGVPEDDIVYTYLSPSITWRPTQYFSLTASADYMQAHDTWMPWRGYRPVADLQGDPDEKRFILATIDQTQLTTTLRFDLTLTPDLTIQFYGSPYMDAGKFTEDKLVIDAREKDYDKRYHFFTDEERIDDGDEFTEAYDLDGDGNANYAVPANRDFNYKEFHSNLVVRWEYQTGSTLYLVWANNKSHDVYSRFNFGKDLSSLLGAEGESVFMLKASYLLNF